jgi:DNA-binding NtrC family response regulator
LENAVERAVILADPGKKIDAELLGLAHLPAPFAEKSKKAPDAESEGTEGSATGETEVKAEEDERIKSMEEVEKEHISKVLSTCEGNRTHAAEKLGMNVRTLRNKIKQYSIK